MAGGQFRHQMSPPNHDAKPGRARPSPPKHKMPSVWWALVSPALVNMVLLVSVGDTSDAEVVVLFWTFLGPVLAGLVCQAVIGPRILARPGRMLLLGWLVMAACTVANFFLAVICCIPFLRFGR